MWFTDSGRINQSDLLARRVEEVAIIDANEMLEGDQKLLKVSQNGLSHLSEIGCAP